jgi:superfamily II DNA or RNA helicase
MAQAGQRATIQTNFCSPGTWVSQSETQRCASMIKVDNLLQSKVTPRPYQVKTIELVFTKWSAYDHLLIVYPTGGGKTIVFAHVAQRRRSQGPVLILAHRDELIEQATEKIAPAVGIEADKEKAQSYASLSASIIVASVHTISRQAAMIIDGIFKFKKHEPATEKQLRYMRFLGHTNPFGTQITQRQAGRWIQARKAELEVQWR